jgi:hypothetical protein
MESGEQEQLGPGVRNEKQSLPAVGEPVWVQCGGYRTMAYRDDKGRWKTVAKGEELKGSVQVVGD